MFNKNNYTSGSARGIFGILRNNLKRTCLLAILCTVLTGCAIFGFAGIFGNIYAKADATTTADRADIVSYRISGTCTQMEAGWVAAVQRSIDSKSQVKIILGNDWVAADNATYTTSFGSTAGFFESGQIYINSGMDILVDLNGHKIDRNMTDKQHKSYGRVIYAHNGKLTIEDSSEAKSGAITGGRCAQDSGAAGTDTGNGGGIYVAYATVIFNSGNITGNVARLGGGVGNLVQNGGYFIMNGGYVSGNKAGIGGGLHGYMNVEVHGGVISENTGNGIYIDTTCRFKMTGGSIINNTGCGIMVHVGNSDMTISGGTISGNSSWGILVSNDEIASSPTFGMTISGGSITNNKSGGIRTLRKAQYKFLGSPKIYNNGGAGNLVFANSTDTAPIISGKLNAGAYIGVAGYAGSPTGQPFATGYTAAGNASADVSRYFFADNKSYKVNLNANGSLQLGTGGTTSTLASAWTTAVNNNGTFKMTQNWVAVANSTLGTSFNGASDTVTSGSTPFSNGALCVPSGKTVTLDLNGYTLDRALTTSKDNGRAIILWGTLIIKDSSGNNGGTITGAYNTKYGGIEVANGGKLTLQSGTISGNIAGCAGGVQVSTGGTFTMTGGVIKNNIATSNGGGVQVQGTFNMSGGEITQNTATYNSTGGLGGGVYFHSGTFSVSNTAKIHDNYTTTSVATSNVYLNGTTKINVNGALNSGFKVGVTMAAKTGTFTTGYGTANSAKNPWDYFTSDNGSYEVSSTGTGASKQATLGLLIDVPSTPAGLTFNGSVQEIISNYNTQYIASYTVTATYETGTTKSITVTTPTVDGMFIKARDAADYKITFKLKAGYSWKTTKTAADVTVTATINKKAITAASTVSNKVYDGTTAAGVTVGAITGNLDGSNLTVTATGTFADKNVGTGKNVTIKYTLGGSKATNYTMANKTVTANITKKPITGLVWTNDALTYNGAAQKPVATVGTEQGLCAGDTAFTATVTGEQTNASASAYVATATALANSNYALPAAGTSYLTHNYSISKAELSVTWDGTAITYSGSQQYPLITGVTTAVTQGTLPTKADFTYQVTAGGTNAGASNTVRATLSGAFTTNFKLIVTGSDGVDGSAQAYVTKNYEIKKAALTVTVSGNAWTYDKAEHNLIKDGYSAKTVDNKTPTFGGGSAVWRFATSTDNGATWSSWSTTMPKLTNVADGGTKVKVQVEADNHEIYESEALGITISAADITGATVTQPGAVTYTGLSQPLTVTGDRKLGISVLFATSGIREELVLDKDYEVTYSNSNGGLGNNTNAGTVTVTIRGKGNYDAAKTTTTTYVINKAKITGLSWTLPENMNYSGTTKTLSASATGTANGIGANYLPVSGSDFTYTYSALDSGLTLVDGSAVNAGNYKVTAAIKAGTSYANNFEFDSSVANVDSKEFKIKKAVIKADGILWDNLTQNYTGGALNPTIDMSTVDYATAVDVSAQLTAGDFTYTTQTNAGENLAITATLSASAAENFTFSATDESVNTLTTNSFKISALGITLTETLAALAYVAVYDGEKHDALKSGYAEKVVLIDERDRSSVKWYYSYENLAAGSEDWTEGMPTVKDVADSERTIYFKVTADNHEAFLGDTKVTVTAKDVTVTANTLTVTGKTYDGTADVASADVDVSGVGFSWKHANDELGVTFTAAVYADRNAEENKTVTVSGLELVGAASGNYKLISDSAITTATIAPLKVEIKWYHDQADAEHEGLEVVYDGNSHVAIAVISNKKNDADSDRLDVSFVAEGTVARDKADYPVRANSVITNATGNYTLEGVDLSAVLKITGTGDLIYKEEDPEISKLVYDGTEKIPVLYYTDKSGKKVYLDRTAFESYSVISTSGAAVVNGAAVNAGTYRATIELSQLYDWSGSVGGSAESRVREFFFTVEKATVSGLGVKGETGMTVSGVNEFTVTYNGSAHALSTDWSKITVNGAALDGLSEAVKEAFFNADGSVKGIEAEVYYDGTTATKTNANENGYEVEIRFNVNGNFNAIASLTAKLIIERSEIDISGVSFAGIGTGWSDLSTVYDGSFKRVEVTNLPAGVTANVSYWQSGESKGTEGVQAIGEYTVKATFNYDVANYKLVKTTGGAEETGIEATLKITAKGIDLSGVNLVGDTTGTGGITYDGGTHKVIAANVPEGVTGVEYVYKNSAGETLTGDGVKDAGTYTVEITYKVDANYGSDSTAVAEIRINPAPLTITANDVTVSYGDAPTDNGATFSGLKSGDGASLFTLAYDYKNGSAGYNFYAGVGTYTVEVRVASSATDNYTITCVSGKLNVKARTVNVTWQNSQTDGNTSFEYVYDGVTEFKPYARVTNAVNGDVLTLVVSGGQINAALNCTAKVTDITGANAKNYELPVVEISQTFNVLPKPRTGVIVWDAGDLYYNGQAQAPKAYYFENETDRVPKELTVTTNVAAINKGTYTATATLGSNYELKGETTKEFEIKARRVYINIDDATVKFGNNIDLSGLTWTYVSGSDEFVSGEAYTITFDCGSITAKGKYAIAGKFTSNNAGNYEVRFVGSWISTDDKNGKCGTLTVTEGTYDTNGITFTGTEVTYDGMPHGITVNGLPEGVTVESVTYVKDGKIYAAADVVKAGEYTVEIVYKSTNPNFTALTGTTVKLTIKKAALTVKANDNTIVYGEEPAANSVTYSGWVNGEDESVGGILSGALQYAFNYTRYGKTGTYRIDIVEGCILSENYEITFIPGTLTVQARELSVEWFADDGKNSKVYKYTFDATKPETEYVPVAVIMSGVVNGDSVTLVVSGAQSKIGVNYKATASSDNANYVVKASDATVLFSIIPAEKYTVIWDNAEITYNGETQKPSAIYYDESGNEHVVPASAVQITKGNALNAGNHSVSIIAGTTAADGHTLTWEAHDFEILPAEITVTISPATTTVPYGKVEAWINALGASDWSVTSGTLYGTDNLQLRFVVNADNTSGVGTYAITAESGNVNYAVTVIAGVLTVEKAEVVMNAAVTGVFGTTPKQYTENYNGATHELKITGALPEGITSVRYEYYQDNVLVSSYGVKNAGTYTVKAVFTTDGNHKVTAEYSATLTIKAKAVGAITLPASESVTYDGRSHSLLLSGDSEAVDGVKFTYVGAVYGAVGAAVNADTYTVTAVITFNANYDASGLSGYNSVTGELTLTGTLVIRKATLTVTAKSGATEYGAAATGYGYEITGFVNGESKNDTSVIEVTDVVYGYRTGKNAAGTNAGRYDDEITVTLSYTSSNYEVKYAVIGGTLTVTPKVIDSSDVIWYDKDGGTSGTEFTYKYDGNAHVPVAVYAADANVTLTVSGAQSLAGDRYTATVTGIGGANGANYELPVVDLEVTFNITNEPVVEYEVIWNNTVHEYDNTSYKPTAYYYDGNTKVEIPSSDVTVAGGSAVNAGTYTASVPAQLNGHVLTNTTVSFSIAKRTVYIEIGDIGTRYGEVPNMSAVSWKYLYGDAEKQFLAGERYTITFTCEADSTSAVGTYPVSGHFVAANARNYEVIFVGSYASASAETNGKYGTLTIEKATYDMSKVTYVGTEVTYDGAAHVITLSGLPVGLTSANYECVYSSADGWKVTEAISAGVYNVTITFKGLDTENYEPVEALTATLTIKKAALIVTANDHTVIYGETATANGVSYEGFVTGSGTAETESVLKGQLTFTYNYTQGDNAGTYRIVPSGLSSGNYEITFRAGTLTVDKRTVTVKWYYDTTRGDQALQYVYDNGKLFAPVAVAENLLAGDSAEITVSGAQGDVGVNITATASSISNSNYKLPTDGSESVKFSILPARNNYVIWDNTEFVYDGAAHKPEAFYIDSEGNRVNIDSQYITVDVGEAVDAKAGYYLAAIDTTYYNSNNLAGDRQFRFYIKPLEITLEVNAQTATYGNVTVAQNAWSYAAGSNKFIDGGRNPVSGGTALEYLIFAAEAGNTTPVGTYTITLVCTNGNYVVRFTDGTLTINKATVVMTDAVTGVFDNGTTATTANTYEYDGQKHVIEVTGELPVGITGVTYEYYLNGKLVSTNGVKGAGQYTVKAIFSVDGNYEEITTEYTAVLLITEAEINIDNVRFEAEKTVVYSGEEQQVFVSGTAIGVERVEYEYYEYDASAADNIGARLTDVPKNVGKYVVIARFIAAENYTSNNAYKKMVLEVTRAALTVVIDNKTTVYGTAAPVLGKDYAVSGLLGSDGESVLGTIALEYTGYTGAASDAGDYVIAATAGTTFDVANYTVTVVNGTLTVTKYFINADEVEWTDSDGTTDKTYIYSYDGVTEYRPYAVAVIGGERVILTVTVSGENATSGAAVEVGSYTATVTGVTGSSNYEVAADINCAFVIVENPPEEYEVVWTDTHFVYDGTVKKPTASYYDGTAIVTVAAGDITVTGDLTDGKAINAGTYEASVTVNGKVFTEEFTIAAKKVSVIIGEVQTVYGTAPDLSNVSYETDGAAVADIASGITFRSTISLVANVGTYANAIEGVYTGSANYVVIFTNGTLRINKARLDTSGIEFEDSVVTYDGKKHAVIPSSLPEGLTATVSYYTAANGWSYDIDGVVAAGTYTVTVSLVLDASIAGNYEPVSGMTGTLVIKKAALTVTAVNNAITYGDAPAAHEDGVAITGFVNGEDESVLKGRLEYGFNYNVGGSAGTYSITPSGLRADNYEITFKSGVLTVNKRVVTISWYKDSSLRESEGFRYPYDGATEYKPHAVAGNLVGNDSATLTVSGGQVNAGLKYLATVTKISNNNYALPTDGSESVSFDIIPRSHVIVWENTEFIYNAQRQAPSAYYFDENGKQVELSVTVNGYPQQAGEYVATAAVPSGITLTGDPTRKFEIKPKEITVEILSVTATYKQLPQFDQNGWRYVGSETITDGNYIGLICPITSMTDPDAGKYPITGVCTSSNYKVTWINGTYTIEKQEIPVPVPASKDYTGTTQIADVVASDMYNVIRNDGGVNVGKYPVTFILNAAYARNYKWAGTEEYYLTVDFEITRAQNKFTTPFEMNWTVDTSDTSLGKNEPETLFGTPVITFYYDQTFTRVAEESYILNSATPGMTFYVKVSVDATDNYEYLEFTHEILIVGDRALALNWETFSAVYDGQRHIPQAYVNIEGKKVYLKVTVDGAAIHAGEYVATVEFEALDGTNLTGYKLYEGSPSADKELRFTIAPREVRVEIGDIRDRVYGTPTVNVDMLLSKNVYGTVVGGDKLNIKFTGTFNEVNGYVPVGSYAIVGSWDNSDYTVIFFGNWTGDEYVDAQTAGVYTVIPADISVKKSGSDWFDQDNVIDKNQSVFITLDERNADDTEYVNIGLKGDKSAKVTITYSFVYEYDDSKVMTDEMIKSFIVEGNHSTPEILQAGDWVIYYRITEGNHNVKYGQWIVRIRKNTEYIIVNFQKAFTMEYGETVFGTDLITQLIDDNGNSEYIELGEGVEGMTLLQLRRIARAYAYEDVTSNMGFVGGNTPAGKYSIRFMFREEYADEYADIEFKYSDSNDKADTNLDKYEVTRRKLSLEWGGLSYVYDGASHIPEATLKGLVGGETVELTGIELGVRNTLQLKNGDVLNVTVSLYQGANTSNAGAFILSAVIDNENYELKTGSIVTVNITRRALEIVWSGTSFDYDGASHIPTATIKGFAGGAEITLNDIVIGEIREITLENGEVVKVRVTLISGADTVNGNYGLAVEIVDNENYELKTGSLVTVTITDNSKVSLPNWAIYVIVAAAVVAFFIILIIALKLKKRGKAVQVIDDDGFNDDYVNP